MEKTRKTNTINKKEEKEKIKRKPPGKLFSENYQPPPEAKMLGWQKRRAILKLRKEIIKNFVEFSLKKLDEAEKIKSDRDKTVLEEKIIRYLLDEKTDLDFINRALEYAKQEIELNHKTSSDDFDPNVLLKIYNDVKEDDNSQTTKTKPKPKNTKKK